MNKLNIVRAVAHHKFNCEYFSSRCKYADLLAVKILSLRSRRPGFSFVICAGLLAGCASNEQLFARYDALCHQGICVAARPTEVFYTPEVSLIWEPAVYFGYDLDTLQESEISRLNSNLEFLNRYEDLKISLQGFTDSNASNKYNLALSDRRVRHVRDYLLEKGIADERILASRAGESLPIKSGNSIEDQIINRRVEMMLLDASGRPLSVGVNPEVADPHNFVAPAPDRKIKE